MSTHRNIDKICVIVLALTLLLTVIFMNGEKLGIRVIADEDAESYSGSAYFTANDLAGDWADNSYTTYITLDGSDGKIKGNGAYFLNGDLVISGGGWYVLSGTLDDGSIIVDAHDSSKIWIRLNGVTVNCSDDACLQVDQADKVFLTLAEGTENSFFSGSAYSEDALSDNTGGTIFSHDDLTINGSGSLTVTAEYKHGIDVNDSFVITGGTVSVTAPQDGIHVNDSFRFTEASLTIDAGDDAVHSDGEIYIESGTIDIPSCYEGLEAVTIDIVGGDVSICPVDDGLNANGGSSATAFGGMQGGQPAQMGFGGPTQTQSAQSEAGGTAQDQAAEAESGGPTQDQSTETESDGTGQDQPAQAEVDRPAQDQPAQAEADGMTQDQSAQAEADRPAQDQPAQAEADRPAQDQPAQAEADGMTQDQSAQAESAESDAEAEETYIRISGGTLTITNGTGRDADGLDSNGNIYIEGGDIRISLTGDSGNSAIDFASENGGECIVTGGTIIAFGGSGMTEPFSSEGTQCAVLYNTASSVQAGTEFRVTNADGEEILSWTPDYNYSSVAFSSPEMTVGETYTLVFGESSEALTLDSTAVTSGSGGGMGGMGGMQHGGMGGTPPEGMGGMQHGGMGGQASGSTEEGTQQAGTEGGNAGAFPGQGGSSDTSRPAPPDGMGGTPPAGMGGAQPGTTEDGAQQAGTEDGTAGAFPSQDGSSDTSRPAPPDGMGGAQPGGAGPMPEDLSDAAEAQEVTPTGFTALSDIDNAVWLLLAASGLALVAAILIAKRL